MKQINCQHWDIGQTHKFENSVCHAISHSTDESLSSIIWGFVGLAIVALITSIISQIVLIRLSQDAVLQLRMHLSRQILASELSHIEQLGTSRLLATLTEDVQAVTDAVRLIPFLCIDVATVAGSLIYITWLYWQASLMVFGLLGVAMGSCQWLLKRGERSL
jgi:putative ATP-binding cassette transporter